MEFIGDIARKSAEPSLLAVEAMKSERAAEIGRDSGLFYVPKVLNFDQEKGTLDFERLDDLTTLLEMAVAKDDRLYGLLERAGRALAVVHEKLILPDEMKYELPSEWMGPATENVFIHGDFGCRNICFHGPTERLVILDWSAAPLIGRTPTFGSRYFDILWFGGFMFRGAPNRRMHNWNAEAMTQAFIRGYAENVQAEKLRRFKDYSPKMCRLQREYIWLLVRHKRLYRAVAYFFCQLIMYARLYIFLRRWGRSRTFTP